MARRDDEPRKCPPERAEHLKATRWRPGQSGNPGGRPAHSRGLVRRLREMAGLPAPESWRAQMRSMFPDHAEMFEDSTMEDVIVWGVIQRAAAGTHAFVDTMLERLDGRAVERVEIAAEHRPLEELDDTEFDRILEEHLIWQGWTPPPRLGAGAGAGG